MGLSFNLFKHLFAQTRQPTWQEIFACAAGIPVCPVCDGINIAISGAWDQWAHGHCRDCKTTDRLEQFQLGQIPAGTLRHGQRLVMQCPSCGVGSQMVARQGRRGWFLGCSNYPACHKTMEVDYE